MVAAALRIAFVATATVQSPLRADAGEYASYARNLIEHGVYSLAQEQEQPPPDSFRSPGFPLFVAACRLVAGEGGWYAVLRWLQVGLSTLTVLLAYRLARRMLPFSASVVAAALVACSPHLVVSPAFVLTECLTAFVVTLALWAATAEGSRWRTGVGVLALGFAPLCNETLVFLPLVFFVARWRRDRLCAVGLLVVAMLPLALWHARNQTTELARRGSERAIASISHGSYPGMVFADERYFGFPYREDPAQPEMAASWSNLFEVLGPRIAADPMRYAVWYALQKPVWLWSWPLVQGRDVCVYPVADSPYERQAVMAFTHRLMRWGHAPVMLLAAVGVLLGLGAGARSGVGHWRVRALAATAVLGTLAYVPVIPDPRYLQPIRPLLFVLAAAAIPWSLALLRSRHRAASDACAGPGVIAPS